MSRSGSWRLEVQHLGDDQVRDLVVDLLTEEDDALAQQHRVDVEGPLAALGLLEHHRHQGVTDLSRQTSFMGLLVGRMCNQLVA